MNNYSKERLTLIDIGRKLYMRQMVAGSDGNLSVRLGNGRILVSPSGSRLGELAEDDFVIVDSQGNKLEGIGLPTSELKMHLYVYNQRPEINCCVHSHPPNITAFAISETELPENVLPEVLVFVGPIRLTKYAPPGTDAVPESLAPFIENADCFLLKNHGLLTVGKSSTMAFNRHETVEHFAGIILKAMRLGEISKIPDEDIERLKEMRVKFAS